MRKYNLDNSLGQIVIWYEEDGVRVSFMEDPANSNYQAYLNKDKAEQSTPMVTDEASPL